MRLGLERSQCYAAQIKKNHNNVVKSCVSINVQLVIYVQLALGL